MGLNFSLEYKVEAKSMGAASLPQGLYTSAFRPMQYKKRRHRQTYTEMKTRSTS